MGKSPTVSGARPVVRGDVSRRQVQLTLGLSVPLCTQRVFRFGAETSGCSLRRAEVEANRRAMRRWARLWRSMRADEDLAAACHFRDLSLGRRA